MKIASELKAGFRNAQKNILYTLLNIGGLVFGLTSVLVIVIYLLDENGFDRFHNDWQQIYRVTDEMKFDEDFYPSAIVPSGWSDALASDVPEILAVGRINQSPRFNPTVKHGDKSFNETGFIFMDSTLLTIFSYQFLYKKPGNPLTYPNGILISDRVAKKYFGEENPLGKELEVVGDKKYQVTGVIDAPRNSSFSFEFASLLEPPADDRLWAHTFIKVSKNTSSLAVESKVQKLISERFGEKPYVTRQGMHPRLQPLASIHYHSELKFEFQQNSSMVYAYVFMAVGFIILIATVFNFINLTTARATTRFKEVSVRKILGADKNSLVWQLVIENAVLILMAFGISLALLTVINPLFNSFSGKQIFFFQTLESIHWIYILSGVVLLSFLSSIYPAYYLTSHGFSNQNSMKKSSRYNLTRTILIVGQFLLSSSMIFGGVVLNKQLHLFQGSSLGFDKESTVVLRFPDENIKKNHVSFRKELLKNSAIRNVSFTQTIPGERDAMAVLVYQKEEGNETTIIPTFLSDLSFCKTLDLKLLAGRYFSEENVADRKNCIVNRQVIALMGWTPEEALGREMNAVDLGLKGKIIGVTDDFNFSSLHHEVEPLVIFPILDFPQVFNRILVNIAKQDEEIISVIEEVWNKFTADAPFNYQYLGDHLNTQYSDEHSKARVFELFVFLSIILALIGLFGLTFFSLERRTKEISVRKVLGASNRRIVISLSVGFLKLVVIAGVIAAPFSYFAMNEWLNNFPYRVSVGAGEFFISVLFNVFISWLTILFLVLKKARVAPAQQLKYE